MRWLPPAEVSATTNQVLLDLTLRDERVPRRK